MEKRFDSYFLSRKRRNIQMQIHPKIVVEKGRQQLRVDPSTTPEQNQEKHMSLFDMAKSPSEAIRRNRTLVKFALVGASGVVVTLIFLTILRNFMNQNVANVIAVEISIINNFLWNDKYTFQSRTSVKQSGANGKIYRLLKYNLVSLFTSIVINEAIFYLLTSHGVDYVISSLTAIAVAFAVNYVGSSRWAWKDRSGARSSDNENRKITSSTSDAK